MPADDRQAEPVIKLPSIHEMFSGFEPSTSQNQVPNYQHRPQPASYRHPPVPPPTGQGQTCYSHAQDAPYVECRRASYPAQNPGCSYQYPAYADYSCQCMNQPPGRPWQASCAPDPHHYSQSRAPYPCQCSPTQDTPSANHWSSASRTAAAPWNEPSRMQSYGPPTRFVPVNQSIRKFSPSANAFDESASFDGDPRSKHVCHQCHKTFTRPSSLRIHMNTHTGATPFKCPWPACGREFNVNSNMRRHLRSHKASMERLSRQSSPGSDRHTSNSDFRVDDISLISPDS